LENACANLSSTPVLRDISKGKKRELSIYVLASSLILGGMLQKGGFIMQVIGESIMWSGLGFTSMTAMNELNN